MPYVDLLTVLHMLQCVFRTWDRIESFLQIFRGFHVYTNDYPVTIFFTLAMLTSVEKFDGRPELGSPPQLDCFRTHPHINVYIFEIKILECAPITMYNFLNSFIQAIKVANDVKAV